MTNIISCFTNSYGRFGAVGTIENLRAASLNAVELAIRTSGVVPFFKDEPLVTNNSTADELRQADELIAAHHVQISSCNITTGNPLERDVVELTKRKLEVAKHFNVSLVVGGAGEANNEQQRETLLNHLCELGDFAKTLGITYCFETHPGLCVSPQSMLETMTALNHSHLKLNFDTGNILYYNENADVEMALRMVCPHVAHVHLKDSRGQFNEWHFPALGQGGAIDFIAIKKIFDDYNYTGPYSLEIEGVQQNETDLPLEQYQQRIADSVTHLQKCGYFDAIS